ncbi:MAG: redoxin family protein [Alphaproteobacteria bacterium]
MIDFWTYSCIKCIRTLPYITSWHDKYKDDGLVIIGVHAPEFAFEGEQENVEKAIKKFGIAYPVAMDNDFTTWKNFKNQYWPAHYLMDRDGKVVYTHFGEGKYDVTESNIRYLLGIKGTAKLKTGSDVTTDDQTHETYLGIKRASNEADSNPDDIPLHHWALNGGWQRSGEHIQSTQPGAQLTLHYRAKKVFLVMESVDHSSKKVNIIRDGKPQSIEVNDSKLYDIVIDQESKEGVVTIQSEEPGVRLFAFTFES